MGISKRNWWLLAAAILIGAAPAHADITAHYGNPAGLVALTAEADAKGEIRFSRIMTLQSVDAKPVAPSEFGLPATVLTRGQYEARAKLGTPPGWPR